MFFERVCSTIDSVASTTQGNTLWALTDHLGSVWDLIDNNGIIREHNVYDSFGRLVREVDYNAAGQVIASTDPAAVDTLVGYTGRLFDSHTGLQYNRARWYDATTGRWLSQDPIGFAAGDANLYRYVGNGPTSARDPTGETKDRVTPEGVKAKGGGHHVVPFQRWEQKHLPVSVQHVFNQVIRHNVDHSYNHAHIAYNKRVGDLLDTWLSSFQDVSTISPEQAQEFWNCIRHSDDAYIKGYLDLVSGLKSKDEIAKWYARTGKQLLENSNDLSALGKGAKVAGLIASKAGKVFKVVSIGTAFYYLSEGGVIYAAERTVKDAVFFDEIRPYANHVATIVNGKLDAAALRMLDKRFHYLDDDLKEPFFRRHLKEHPDLYRLKYGCDPE